MKRSFLIWALATIPIFTTLMVCAVQGSELSEFSPYSITTIHFTSSDEQSNEQSGVAKPTQPYSLLLITGFNSDILENELTSDATMSGTFDDFSSTKSFVVSGKYDATSRFAITGAFGITQKLSTQLSDDYANKSSWEANVGMVYKFSHNVNYGFNFGYLDPGNVFSDRARYTEDEAVIMINNKLSLSF